jgi:hypothetical protein
MTNDPLRRVAIACQGGGSHTAFTAGVLARLFDGDELDGCEVVGLSGTSGGAVCVFAPDVELTSTGPFPVRSLLRGEDAHDAVREQCKDVRMDLTHKQLTREQAVWTVRLDGSASDTQGRIEAAFEDGRVVRVQLDPAAL